MISKGSWNDFSGTSLEVRRAISRAKLRAIVDPEDYNELTQEVGPYDLPRDVRLETMLNQWEEI